MIVDSMASLLRAEFGGKDGAIRRAEMLGQQISLLKQLAERLQLVVLVTNQITTVLASGEEMPGGRGGGGGGASTSAPQASTLGAALGVKWAHAVNTRLQMEMDQGERWVCVAKSPMAPPVRVPYLIEGRGAVPNERRSLLPYVMQGEGGVVAQHIPHQRDYYGPAGGR